MGHPDDADEIDVDEILGPVPGVAGEPVTSTGPPDLVAAAPGWVDLDEEATEQLLAGHPGRPELLRLLLSQAAAPARPDELTGEEAAMAAFRAARAPARTPALAKPRSSAPRHLSNIDRVARPRPWARPRLWARLASVKAGVLMAALTAGGAALATGALLYPGLHPSQLDSPPSGAWTPSNAVLTSAPGPVTGPDASGGPGGAATPTGPDASPGSDSLAGRCHAYLAQVAAHPEKEVLDHPSFARLVEAAGGPDQVGTYCLTLLTLTGPSASSGTGAGADPASGNPSPSGSRPMTRAGATAHIERPMR